MGKQINFFMTGIDELRFFEVVRQTGDILLDYFGNPLSFVQLEEPIIYTEEKPISSPLSLFFITISNAKIDKRQAGGLEPISSEVIQINRSAIKKQNQLWNGRIWFENNAYDTNGKVIEKPAWLKTQFNDYRKWITKNLKPNRDKDFYIGEDAYKLYKEQGFKMLNAPKVAIEFD